MKFKHNEEMGCKTAPVWVGVEMTEQQVKDLETVAKAEGQKNFRDQLRDEITAYLQERLPGRVEAAAEILKQRAADVAANAPKKQSKATADEIEAAVQARLMELGIVLPGQPTPELEEVPTAEYVADEVDDPYGDPGDEPEDDEASVVVKRLRAKKQELESAAA